MLVRRPTHSSEKYLSHDIGEIPRLQQVEDALIRLNAVLTWTRKENIEELLIEIEDLADQALQVLSPFVVVSEKTQARDYIINIRQGRDSLSRVNPSALLAQLVATRRRVNVREEGISNILDVFAARRQAVQLAVALLEAQVRVSYDFLNRTLESWRTLISARPQFLADQLEESAKAFPQFAIMPFLPTFRYSADEFTRAAAALRQKKFGDAHALLETARTSFQLRLLRTELEHTVFAVSRAVHFPSQTVDLAKVSGDIQRAERTLQTMHCDGMRDFSLPRVFTGLSEADAFFSLSNPEMYRSALKQGHMALRQVVSTI